MNDDKDDLKSIKVYKFDNTKERWHEFGHIAAECPNNKSNQNKGSKGKMGQKETEY